MAVIALVGNKGGAGKTTLSINLAVALAEQADTVLMDADPQGSSVQWKVIGDSHLPVVVAGEPLDEAIATMARQHQHVVVDCPPSVQAPQTHEALQACDVALIPVQPSPVDLWATVHIEQAIERAKQANSQLSPWLIINQLEPRTTLSRLVREAVAEIDIPVAETAIRRRAIYRSSVLEGKSVYDMGRRGADAVSELNQLIREVIPS
ncbi:ParA family partition ATPase [Thiohalophilus thiocyanatoxydans]|uniref:Plasmid segregation oscillating ATPase ParF n=1 Tax=Thiohalophilus thiocyanatoxydans TaxID=381308 RepID=A0A4R8ISL3_9GAMM|nr:ParA family partition ATPase [Thiohalophilus thiocyanatoxydans]TDY04032.1 plasmid segregation oscillating ATPase ParF [Thiohalophilus thiocyanatoxydans]